MEIEKEERVGIQGITTSFHEVAAHTYFNRPIDVIECLDFYKLCTALENEECDYAVMAIENSIAGSILPNYFLLQDFHFKIVGEVYLPIHLHLLTLPGIKLSDIRAIESHPMAIRQCSDYLNRMGDIVIREGADTALTARRIVERNMKDTAAIANEWTAKKFGMNIIERRIETHKKNFTRFIVLKKDDYEVLNANKASLSFEVANTAGSLADVLILFKDNNINMLRIQSIPIIGKPEQYFIHVDIEWKKRTDYEVVMGKIIRRVKSLTVFGEYKKGVITY